MITRMVVTILAQDLQCVPAVVEGGGYVMFVQLLSQSFSDLFFANPWCHH